MAELLGRILTFVLCPGGLVVAIVGAVLLIRRRTRLGIALLVAGAAMVVLYVVVIFLAIRDLG